MRVSLHAFCSDVSDEAFNIEILYMPIFIKFYNSGTLWKVAGGDMRYFLFLNHIIGLTSYHVYFNCKTEKIIS